MTKIAIVVKEDGTTYPIYRTEGRYQIDFGGATGLSDPLEFPNDTTAINWLRKVVLKDPYEC